MPSLTPRSRVVSQVQIARRRRQRKSRTTTATMAASTMPPAISQPGFWKIHWTIGTIGSGSGDFTTTESMKSTGQGVLGRSGGLQPIGPEAQSCSGAEKASMGKVWGRSAQADRAWGTHLQLPPHPIEQRLRSGARRAG